MEREVKMSHYQGSPARGAMYALLLSIPLYLIICGVFYVVLKTRGVI
jgi:hypothetical protein